MDAADPTPQDATERLRARFAAQPLALTPPPRRPVVAWTLVALLLVFALGLIANPWFEANVRQSIPGLADPAPPASPPDARFAALDARLSAAEAARALPPAAAAAAPEAANERVAALEARLDGLEQGAMAGVARIDTLTASVAALTGRVDANAGQIVLTLQAARADADRAQGALGVVAARRALDAGQWTPALDAPLRALFGASQGPAVEAVIALGAAPATRATLRRDLARLRGVTRAPDTGWWGDLTAGLSGIVEVRTRGPRAADPLARANALLVAGDVAGALVSVERLPRSAGVAAWTAAARRWLAGQRGLLVLEGAALAARPAPVLAAVAPTAP